VHGGGICLRRLSGGSRSAEVRFHRFLANPRVTVEKLISGWSEKTVEAVAGRDVLAIQDTSEINFRTPGGRHRGLGVIGKGLGRGILLHPMIAVDARTGECLGLVGGHAWTRADKKGETKKNNARRPLSEKESRHWIETAQTAKTTLGAAKSVTMIADREADIFQLWAQVPGPNVHVLGRLFRERPVIGGGSTTTIAGGWPVRDTRKISIREREDREEREAFVQLRFGQIAISRPATAIEPGLPEQISLTLIELSEMDAPQGAEPIVWRLLTSHVVDEAAAAWRMVDAYRQRWIIEQFFRTLKKQGLQIEDSQIESAERLLKLVALAAQAAVTTLQLVQARDGLSALPAVLVFSKDEIAALDALNKTKYAARTALQKNPHQTFSLPWAAWIVARLGGWDGYPSSRPPGPITFKTGLDVLKPLAAGWALRDVCMP
jgi:Transposase DDE domain